MSGAALWPELLGWLRSPRQSLSQVLYLSDLSSLSELPWPQLCAKWTEFTAASSNKARNSAASDFALFIEMTCTQADFGTLYRHNEDALGIVWARPTDLPRDDLASQPCHWTPARGPLDRSNTNCAASSFKQHCYPQDFFIEYLPAAHVTHRTKTYDRS